MEASQIVKARARAAELHAKIETALQRSYHDNEGRHGSSHSLPHAQNLRAIRSALLHLQDELDSLQALQKRHKFEKEHLLVELEERRNLLIRRLREYKGTEWEIVQEAHAFVGEPVQKEDILMLPPYESSTQNTYEQSEDTYAPRERCHADSLLNLQESRIEGEQNDSRAVSTNNKSACTTAHSTGFVFGLSKLALRAGKFVLLSAKSVVVIVGIMFTVSRLEPPLKKWSSERTVSSGFRIYGSAHRRGRPSMPNRSVAEDEFCPPGKVLLLQDGIHKCAVKERTEVPFKEVFVRQPDATYGYG